MGGMNREEGGPKRQTTTMLSKRLALPEGVKALFWTMLRGLKTLTPRGSKRAQKKPQTHRRRGSKTALEAPTGGLKTPFQNFHFLGDVCGETFFFWRAGLADFWRQFGRKIGKIWLHDGRQMGGLLAPIWAHDWHITSSRRASDGHRIGMSWGRRFGGQDDEV